MGRTESIKLMITENFNKIKGFQPCALIFSPLQMQFQVNHLITLLITLRSSSCLLRYYIAKGGILQVYFL